MPNKYEISAVMAALGKRRWRGKTKAERAAHMRMMSLEAVKKRKKKKSKKPPESLDT
jgi:hypothetical protein